MPGKKKPSSNAIETASAFSNLQWNLILIRRMASLSGSLSEFPVSLNFNLIPGLITREFVKLPGSWYFYNFGD